MTGGSIIPLALEYKITKQMQRERRNKWWTNDTVNVNARAMSDGFKNKVQIASEAATQFVRVTKLESRPPDFRWCCFCLVGAD